MTDDMVVLEPWDELERMVDAGSAEEVATFMHMLDPGEVSYTISHLDDERRLRLMALLPPDLAADLMEHLTDDYAADLIEELPAETAAAIVDEMDSDDQADILGELDHHDAAAILARMDPQEAEEARELVQYRPETAGGLMITEYLTFDRGLAVGDVIGQLRSHTEEYADYEVPYIYVTSGRDMLAGVVRLRELILAPASRKLADLMIDDPARVNADDALDVLEDFFDHHSFNAAPVVEASGELVGVVRRAAVEEALGERADRTVQRLGGIIGGEERRSLSTPSRAMRRLAFLAPNIVLAYMSISIIAMHESVVHRITALAIFLPLVAGMSGASANQAISVSIRELALDLVRPPDFLRVIFKELGVGLINGLVIALILGLLATATRSSVPGLGWAVGLAFAVNSVIAVSLGGVMPLLLKALRCDPAMASGPITTTLTDMCSFFFLFTTARLLIGG